jgi:hypothetical protein
LGLLLALDILGLLTPSTARAGLLPLNFPNGAAIISGSNGGLTYNSTTGDFNVTLTGPSLVYAAPFVKPRGFTPIVNGSLSIDLVVDKSGKFVSNGKGLELTGTATINGATFGGNNNPLLLGTITDFGSEAAGPPTRTFDGFFTITGGALTQTETGSGGNAVFDGFPLGGSGGFLLSAENVTSGTLGDFSRNFSSSSVKPEVGPVVPEPSSLVLLLRAAVVLPAWGLRRKCLPASAAG